MENESSTAPAPRPPYTRDPFGLMDRLFAHTREQGGTLALATGIQGSGKTTLLLVMARLFLDQGEVVFWRGRDIADAWTSFPGTIMIWSDYPIRLLRAQWGQDTAEPWNEPPIHTFTTTADLIARAKPGVLNVVYAREKEREWIETNHKTGAGHHAWKPTRFWGRMVKALKHKRTARFHVLIVDEAHELWPDRPEGDDYHHQADVRDDLADFRKSFNTLLAATHHPDELDYRIRNKLQFQIYTRGARPGARSQVYPETTLRLEPGEAILESLYFCKMTYSKLQKPPFQVIVESLHPDDVTEREEALGLIMPDQDSTQGLADSFPPAREASALDSRDAQGAVGRPIKPCAACGKPRDPATSRRVRLDGRQVLVCQACAVQKLPPGGLHE